MRYVDLVVIGFVALWFFLVIIFFVKKKKAGKCIGCTGGVCADCPKK